MHFLFFSFSLVYIIVVPKLVLRDLPHPVNPCRRVGVTLSAFLFPLPVSYIVRCLSFQVTELFNFQPSFQICLDRWIIVLLLTWRYRAFFIRGRCSNHLKKGLVGAAGSVWGLRLRNGWCPGLNGKIDYRCIELPEAYWTCPCGLRPDVLEPRPRVFWSRL